VLENERCYKTGRVSTRDFTVSRDIRNHLKAVRFMRYVQYNLQDFFDKGFINSYGH
jgi:hypothetical protein